MVEDSNLKKIHTSHKMYKPNPQMCLLVIWFL